MTSRLSEVTLAAFTAVSLLATTAFADGPLRVPPDEAPDALAILAPDRDALAVTVSRDASLAAVAVSHPDKAKWSQVAIARIGESARHVAVRGVVRALRFDDEGHLLFAIARRAGKSGDVQEAWLVLIDIERLKATRSVSLPASATGLDLWAGGGALVVAGRDEVRTVLLPQIRSGPLFWIPGDNRSVASLPGGDLALVGQDSGILLVSFSDPQGREQLPVRDRVATNGPVVTLATSPDGNEALARLEDGSVLGISLDPLRIDRLGQADFIAWIGGPSTVPARPTTEPPPTPPFATDVVDVSPPPAVADTPHSVPDAPGVDPTESSAGDVSETDPAPEPSSAPPPASPPPRSATDNPPRTTSEPTDAAAPSASGPATPGPATAGGSETPPSVAAPPASTPVAGPTPEAAARPASGPDRGELEGRVSGPAASAVVAVVLLGPDNISREAKRIEPDPDGSWVATDLAPGGYRVVLDAGGAAVLGSDPAFRQARVVAGTRTVVAAFEVLRVIDR